MTIHTTTGAPIWMPDTDRLAASNALYNLADRFTDEAERWTGETLRPQLQRNARLLAQHARQVLTTGTLEVADAYLEAGDRLINETIADRRLLAEIRRTPNRARS